LNFFLHSIFFSLNNQAVREERMGVLNKKQKSEEDKMRTNEAHILKSALCSAFI